jgi:VIT1/CCC1 family predicted Fe2+/Mn2+ transporter
VTTTSRRHLSRHPERHRSDRAGWLRAGVLGANDGLLSTAGLLVGVAAADSSTSVLAATGVASIIAGAASMGVGEYSSVSSQRDAEEADLAVERAELAETPEAELGELAGIYRQRGLDPVLAREVAEELTAHDALGAHARDELGLVPGELARPLQAAVTSTASFTLGALLPLAVALLAPRGVRVPAIVVLTLVGLAVLGATGARLGGAAPVRAAGRVVLGGAGAMTLTWCIGSLFDVSVS